jgi:hypothetical protein
LVVGSIPTRPTNYINLCNVKARDVHQRSAVLLRYRNPNKSSLRQTGTIRQQALNARVQDHVAPSNVTRYFVTRYRRLIMALPSERMKAMRERRRARGLRELRLIVPDARSKTVRRRIAREVARLDRTSELEAMDWIESVAEFDGR